MKKVSGVKARKTNGAAAFVSKSALGAALICVSAMISLPFFVPLTLQTFALYFIIYALGARTGLCSVLIYTALGIIGLPVFAGFSGGVARLFEPSGGFIVGFVLAALVYLLFETIFRRRFHWLPTALSFLVLYASGSLFLVLFYTDGSLSSAVAILSAFVLPYLFPDMLKIALAVYLSSKLKKHLTMH